MYNKKIKKKIVNLYNSGICLFYDDSLSHSYNIRLRCDSPIRSFRQYILKLGIYFYFVNIYCFALVCFYDILKYPASCLYTVLYSPFTLILRNFKKLIVYKPCIGQNPSLLPVQTEAGCSNVLAAT